MDVQALNELWKLAYDSCRRVAPSGEALRGGADDPSPRHASPAVFSGAAWMSCPPWFAEYEEAD